MIDTTPNRLAHVNAQLDRASLAIWEDRRKGDYPVYPQLGVTVADHELVQALLLRADDVRRAWVRAHPALAARLAAWTHRGLAAELDPWNYPGRRRPLPADLRAHAPAVWREQRRALLAARAAIARDDPCWRHAARLVLAGRLASGDLIDDLDTRPAEQPAYLDTWEAHHDQTQLVTCTSCGYHHHRELMANRHCWYCGGLTGPFDPSPVEASETIRDDLRRTTQRPGRRPPSADRSKAARRRRTASSQPRTGISGCIGETRDEPIRPDNQQVPE